MTRTYPANALNVQAPKRHEILDLGQQTVTALDRLGLTDALPDVRAALDRCEALIAEHRPVPDTRTLRAQLARQLADGTLDPAAAATRLAETQAAGQLAEAVNDVTGTAAGLAAAAAYRTLAEHGDRLVEELLRPEIEAMVEAATDAVSVLPDGVRTAEAVVAHQADRPKAGTAAAWGQLHRIHAAWVAVHRLADLLRFTGVLPLPHLRSAGAAGSFADWATGPDGFRYRRPDLAPATPAPLLLPDAVAAGAEPTMLTGAEAFDLAREAADPDHAPTAA